MELGIIGNKGVEEILELIKVCLCHYIATSHKR